MAKRVSKVGFVIDGGKIKQVTGYNCPEQKTLSGDDFWWCPQIGISTVNFYKTEIEAVEELLKRKG